MTDHEPKSIVGRLQVSEQEADVRLSRRPLLIMICAVLAIGVTATAIIAGSGRASTQGVSEAAAQPAADYSVPGGLVAWMEPDLDTLKSNGDQSADGTVFVRVADAQGVKRTADLGPGIDARLWAGGADPVLVVERYDGSNHVFAYSRLTAQWRQLFSLTEDPLSMGAGGDRLVYTDIEHRSTVVSRSKATGEETLRSTVPAMKGYSSDASEPLSLPINYDPSRAQVTAVVPVADHLFAFSANAQASQLTDFPSGLTKAVDSAGVVSAACTASDGRLYAAVEGSEKGDTVKVLGIDPATLKTLSVADTGWIASPVDGPPRLSHLQLLPTRDGVALWIVEDTGNPAIVGSTHLWLLKDGELMQSNPLSQRLGIKAAAGKDDSLLLYGGYARSAVSRVDLSSGQVTPVKELRAPDGSWILVAAD